MSPVKSWLVRIHKPFHVFFLVGQNVRIVELFQTRLAGSLKQLVYGFDLIRLALVGHGRVDALSGKQISLPSSTLVTSLRRSVLLVRVLNLFGNLVGVVQEENPFQILIHKVLGLVVQVHFEPPEQLG